MLQELLDKSLHFYQYNQFPVEISTSESLKAKAIMALIWANATYEDFNEPTRFLQKRIDFFKAPNLSQYMEKTSIGYSELLGSDVEVILVNNGIEYEAPQALKITLKDPTTLETYELPKVYIGISNNEAYIYSIKNDKKNTIEKDKYQKKINRLLYKIDEGFDTKEDTYDNYGVGNLKDVTPSFVLAANITLSLLHNLGINKINIPTVLIERWNSKEISYDYKRNYLSKMYTDEKVDEAIDSFREKHLEIQKKYDRKIYKNFS